MISCSSGLKQMARSIARHSHSSIARQAIRNTKMRAMCLTILEKDIQKELTKVASTKRGTGSSCLRQRNLDALQTFSWEKLHAELRLTAPTFYRVLQGLVNVRRRDNVPQKRRYCPLDSAVLGVCAAILLRHRNHNFNLVQRIISLIIYSGHTS